jgi:hypothetical protein
VSFLSTAAVFPQLMLSLLPWCSLILALIDGNTFVHLFCATIADGRFCGNSVCSTIVQQAVAANVCELPKVPSCSVHKGQICRSVGLGKHPAKPNRVSKPKVNIDLGQTESE